MTNNLDALRDELRQFVAERDWQQFHNPKNLSMALSAEAAEVLEHFLWQPDNDSAHLSAEKRAAVAEELADVLIYLVRLGDVLEIDLAKAAERKLKKNAKRYPAAIVKGRALKYDEF